jgi:hypothetical protein
MRREVLIRPVGSHERSDWEPLWAGYLAFYQATIRRDRF